MLCLARLFQQDEGYQSHAEGQSNTDGEGDLWRDPGANEGLSQRAEHDGKRDGRTAHAHDLAAIFVGGGTEIDAAHSWLDEGAAQSSQGRSRYEKRIEGSREHEQV